MAAEPGFTDDDVRDAISQRHERSGVITTSRPRFMSYHAGRRLRRLAVSGPATQVVTTFEPSPGDSADTAELEQIVAELSRRERSPYERFVKPVIDRVVAALLIVLVSPVFLAATLVLLITLGTPVLLRQPRVGRMGETFGMLKFRTMHPDRRRAADPNYTGPERRLTHKSAHDPRHTRLGRKLRKTSIDELPQLLNVLRGDMSLVGPRPELADLVNHAYEPWQHTRHLVKPGITGLWQITERSRGRMLHECTEIDLRYIQQMSFRGDLRILVRTPLALLRKDGVI